MNIIVIDPATTRVSELSSKINTNFASVKSAVEDLYELINPTSNTIKLTDIANIGNNSIEAAGVALTGVGLVLRVTNGSVDTVTIDSTGVVSAVKYVSSGTGADKSLFAQALINELESVNSDFSGLMKIRGTNSRVATKYRTFTVVDNNTGGSAPNPIDISRESVIYLDCHNGGNALANSGDINLDLSEVHEGQIFRIHCLRRNTSNQRLWNGTSGSEIFAFINPNGNGFQSISHSVKPAFNPQASPDNQSWIEVQWTNIGTGFRLVILDSKNMLGVV